jgi:hypothetical protein
MLRFAGDSELRVERSCCFVTETSVADTHDAKPAR